MIPSIQADIEEWLGMICPFKFNYLLMDKDRNRRPIIFAPCYI